MNDSLEGDSCTYTQDTGKTSIPFFCKYVVPVAECVSFELMEFPAPEIAEFVSDRRSFKRATKSVERPTLRKQFRKGSKQRRVIPTNFIKQASRSRGEIFTNTSRQSC